MKFIIDQIACCVKGDRNKTKAQTFRYRSLLSEQNQNVLIWSAYYRNKSRTFLICSKIIENRIEMFWRFLKFKNEARTKPSSFLIGSKRFHTPMLQTKQNGTFVNYFWIFLLVRNVLFALSCLGIKTKRYKLCQSFPKTKQNV